MIAKGINMMKVGVVGAGAVGLSSALHVQRLLPGSKVTIIADRFGNETTSSGAGGLFRPNVTHIKGVPVDTLKRWSKVSWEHYSGLAMSSEAGVSGNNITNGFILLDRFEPQFLNEVVFTYHEMSQEELRRINSNAKYGYNVTTVITEPKKYLAWLTRKFKDNGGTLEVRTLKSLGELCGQYDVVVNCCGLRADQLVGDRQMKPNRGQLVKVRAPWIRGFHYIEHDGFSTYTVPHADYLIVGGCRQDGNTSTEIDPVMTQSILDRANKLIPGFKGAEVIGHWAGIRPVREPIRVEKEVMSFGGNRLNVVHNYGHGGNGITLSWSTGIDAAQMVKDLVDTRTPSARL